MALSADRNYAVSGLTEILHGKLTAAVTYYKGGILQWDASTGLLKKPADVAGEYGVGALKAGKVVAAGENPDAEIEVGKIWVPFASAAQSDVGDWVYASDDGTITKSALTNGGPCGRAVDFKTGYLLVDFRAGGPKTLAA
jgi:hypothetical protein